MLSVYHTSEYAHNFSTWPKIMFCLDVCQRMTPCLKRIQPMPDVPLAYASVWVIIFYTLAYASTIRYYTPTLLCARITHFQPCTITQSSERISGQKLSISYLPGYWVFARILRFGPLPVLRRIENDQWASGVFNQRIASDYYIVTSYLNAINLLNYNDICLYKQ